MRQMQPLVNQRSRIERLHFRSRGPHCWQVSGRLMRIAVIGAGVLGSLYAARLAAAGQTVSRHMDGWLKTHAMLVTAIAGAIYLRQGSTVAVAKSRDSIRTLVRGIRQGFGLLSAAGVRIAPWKLGLLVRLPAIFGEIYLRRFLARPASELILARHANAVPGELATLVGETPCHCAACTRRRA